MRELQLVDAYRKEGDATALATLLRAYQRRVYAVCYRMVHHTDDAKDLTQDVLLKVIERLEQFDARSQLSTWIIRIAMNASISHLRKRKLRTHHRIDQPPPAATENSDADEILTWVPATREQDPASRVEQEESRAIVTRALASLDPHMRAILVLRDMQSLDYLQIADVLDTPVGTVKSRLFRARAALRDAIEQLSEADNPSESESQD